MKTNYLAAALYLAPALAAPVFQTSTVLVAGASAKTVIIRPGHQTTVEEAKQVAFDGTSLSPSASKTGEIPTSSVLDADRPLTTQELMALSKAAHLAEATSAHQKGPAGGNKIKISVGTLVVPGGAGARPSSSVVAQFFDPKAARPFLISGYYIPAQRPDVWAAGMIISFVLVVVGLELWGLVRQRYVSYTHAGTIIRSPVLTSLAPQFEKCLATRREHQARRPHRSRGARRGPGGGRL